MTVKHYLQDITLGLGERAYWTFYLATRRDSPRRPSAAELKQLGKEHDAASRGVTTPTAAELLLQVANVLYALGRETEPHVEHENLVLSLNLWAALQQYRAASCPADARAWHVFIGTLEPQAWRWDDRRAILLMDLSEGLSVRLWPDLVFHRCMGLLKPSHAHTLVYDPASRGFSNAGGETCAFLALVQAPSTHVYLTRTVAKFFTKPAQIQRVGPLLADAQGQTGRLF